jgi:hypothetical protein
VELQGFNQQKTIDSLKSQNKDIQRALNKVEKENQQLVS